MIARPRSLSVLAGTALAVLSEKTLQYDGIVMVDVVRCEQQRHGSAVGELSQLIDEFPFAQEFVAVSFSKLAPSATFQAPGPAGA